MRYFCYYANLSGHYILIWYTFVNKVSLDMKIGLEFEFVTYGNKLFVLADKRICSPSIFSWCYPSLMGFSIGGKIKLLAILCLFLFRNFLAIEVADFAIHMAELATRNCGLAGIVLHWRYEIRCATPLSTSNYLQINY